ncbi:hypothetical protein CsatA_005025 [Cannabis sativa]
MGSVSSDDEAVSDQQSERCGSYSLSADVSESESCSSFSCRRFDAEGASSSMSSSPRPMAADKFPFSLPVMLPFIGGKGLVSWDHKPQKRDTELSEVELMKERFAKLLLGEDMSGGGKGVCTALAISNAITNLSATVFGELWRLEPLAQQKKEMWRREMEWLLSVCDSIVQLVPTTQPFPGGGAFEVMESRPRADLYINLPALRKLDAMLLAMLDGFSNTEFSYVDRNVALDDSNDGKGYMIGGRPSIRQEDKWWLPYPKVPPNGLSDDARKRLQQCKDCTNQILKAAMTINSNMLAEMEIPRAYLDSLPKTGKACLGDIVYRYITAEQFSPECLLDCLDLSSEHLTIEIVNRVEAAVYIWKKKDCRKQSSGKKGKRSSWGGKVKGLVSDIDKNLLLAQRAESLLNSLRNRFPTLPQTALDMSKIQYNKDVGQSILESYSRVMESVAFNIMARIDDILYVDDAIKKNADSQSAPDLFGRSGGLGGLPLQKKISPSPFSIHHTPFASPLATPSMFSSTPLDGSPGRTSLALKKNSDLDKVWSYVGNLSARRTIGDAPERN